MISGFAWAAVAAFAVTVAVGASLSVLAVASLTVLAVARFLAGVGAESGLLCGFVDVDFLLADTFALLAVGVLGASLVLAFLLGTGALVDGGKIDLAEHLEFRTLRGASEAERLLLFGFLFRLFRFGSRGGLRGRFRFRL